MRSTTGDHEKFHASYREQNLLCIILFQGREFMRRVIECFFAEFRVNKKVI